MSTTDTPVSPAARVLTPKGHSAGPWVEFAVKRSIGLAVTFVVLVLVTFLIVPMIPGDPAVGAAGPDATLADIERVRTQLGLDLPWYTQLLNYIGGLFDGTMGRSFSLNASVSSVIFTRLPFTAGLALIAIVVVLLVAVPVGMSVGVLTRGGRRPWLDTAFTFGTGAIAAIPGYVMATLLVVIFAVTLAVVPPAYSRNNVAASFALPVIALAIGPICIIARVVRRETAVVLKQDYMRTAAGWRVNAVKRYALYALPNLLTSTLTLSGLILTSMLGGAVIVETVFNWPGLGLGVVQAIATKDYPMIQGIVLVLGMLAALLTLLVDTVLGLIDPRALGGRHAD
ncbi:MAG: ABC transporter permease [Microbacterium sp.]